MHVLSFSPMFGGDSRVVWRILDNRVHGTNSIVTPDLRDYGQLFSRDFRF